MKYHITKNEYGDILCLGMAPAVPDDSVEITAEEYQLALAEAQQKAAAAERIYAGEITLAAIDAGWRAEVQRKVDKLTELAGPYSAVITPEERIAVLEAENARLKEALARVGGQRDE